MDKRVIILAAGEQRRFQKDTLKQLLLICDGETFLSRMIRQCKERRWPDIVVATRHKEIKKEAEKHGVETFEPFRYNFTCETIFYTNPLWYEKNIILLGDVYFTKNTMDMIFNGAEKEAAIQFFASVNEVFAFRFDIEMETDIIHSLDMILHKAEGQHEGKVRRLMGNYSLGCWTEVHDETTDIDTPIQYEVFKRDVIYGRKHKLTDRRS